MKTDRASWQAPAMAGSVFLSRSQPLPGSEPLTSGLGTLPEFLYCLLFFNPEVTVVVFAPDSSG